MKFFVFREALGWVMLALREITGWMLIVAGFFFFYLVFTLAVEDATPRKSLEMCLLTVIGVFVFRGGIHLLKVAIAAQVCQQTQDQLYPAAAPNPALPPARQPANQAYGRRPGS